jgi:integrative and conjugative element protein (TIGR02256 family)
MDQHCLIVVRTPIERSQGNVGGESAKAFLTECKAGVLAEKLGAFWEGDGFGGMLIAPPPMDFDALRRLSLMPMDVYRPFDRAVAQAASGTVGASAASAEVTLVGAGALGSQVALTAARMGLGTWMVVDPDHLLPHNMARHGLSPLLVGWAKAEAVSHEIQSLLGKGTAKAVVGRIDDASKAGEALSSAALVIDASASVPTARWLATASGHAGRTASVFLNPLGTDLVTLVEGEARVPRLDHVEMSYYWALANGDGPEDHLSGGKVGLYPSGGCRTPSLTISQADVGALAPFAAKRLLQDALPSGGVIEIRRASPDGVTVFRSSAAEYREAALGEWTVAVSADLIKGVAADRREAGPLETGGVLVGTWDRVRKRVYVVGHYAPPPDSVSEMTGFVRGASGVYQTLETVQRRTAGNLTYIGEWHTHPPGHRSQPSAHDRILLRWIGDVLVYLDVPALMLIVGEDGVRVVMGPGGKSVLFGFGFSSTADDAA